MKKYGFFYLLPVMLFVSCVQPEHSKMFPAESQILGLGSPFKLSRVQSVLLLQDYFIDPSLVDSVTGHETFEFHFHRESGEVVINARGGQIPHYSELRVWIGGVKYSILLEKSHKIGFVYKFDPQGQAYRSVFLFGEINNWNRTATPLLLRDGVWQTELELNPGRYQYLLLIDGKEMLDPNNPEIVDNNIGGFNSLMVVGNVDFKDVPVLFTSSFKNEQVRIGFENDPEKIFVFWQNYRLPDNLLIFNGNELIITIPETAAKMNRSFLRIWAFNKNGASNNLLIPLYKRQVLTDHALLTRQDFEASILYFLLVDRFKNGNPENDEPVDDPIVAPRANYWGGDLDGITQKIRDGYFAGLGINAIWFSPITQNPLEAFVEYPEPRRKYTGYHGYWPVTLTTIDHRFGTSDDLHELVSEAHAAGINVLLDFVSNHVHESNQLIIDNPQWATQLILPDGRKNLRLWDEQRLTTWFDTFLPSLDLTIPEAVETMTDSAIFWIKNYNLDGFRHDATKHIPENYWRRLTYKLKKEVAIPENRRIYQIGETFGSRELIGSYVGSGMLDGQFDFNLFFDARSVFALDDESFVRMNQSLMKTFDYYGHNHLMGNITGNHDLPRFISFASGALRFDENSAEAGWNRDIQVEDTDGYAKLSMLTAFMMTIPGVPVVYYGDEIGMAGGGDPDSRRPMRFDGLNQYETRTREIVSQLGKLRQQRLSLIYGDFNVLHITDETWVYARRYFDEVTIVAFNKGDSQATIMVSLTEALKDKKFCESFGAKVTQNEEQMQIVLQPYSFEILTD